MSFDLRPIVYKAEYLLLERSILASFGVRLQIIHRFRIADVRCHDGEEVAAVLLVHGSRSVQIGLSLALRLIVDYLARHRNIGQSASQVAAGIRTSSFYRNHGANSGASSRRKISRTAIKEYVKRIRRALSSALREVGLDVNPTQILVSHRTEGNEVLYKLRAAVEWLHEDDLP
jgi:hypothetical protein